MQGAAVSKWRLARVSMTKEYLERPAVPAPLDLPIFLSKLFPSTSTLLVKAASKVDLPALWLRARALCSRCCACCLRAARGSPDAPQGSPGSPASGIRNSAFGTSKVS